MTVRFSNSKGHSYENLKSLSVMADDDDVSILRPPFMWWPHRRIATGTEDLEVLSARVRFA